MYRDPLSAHGVVVKWGAFTFTATSIQYSSSAAAEVDITSMSSRTVADTTYPGHKLVVRSVDYAVVDPGEVSLDFIATTSEFSSVRSSIGMQRPLRFEQVKSEGGLFGGQFTTFAVTAHGFLTQFSAQAQVGDFVRGTCTFKLSDS